MLRRFASKRISIRLANVMVLLLVVGGAFGAGMLARPWSGRAAPGDIEVCVNRSTGAVRMHPSGVTACATQESKVTWPAAQATFDSPEYTQRTVITGVGAGSSGTLSIPCNVTGSEFIATGGGFQRADPALVINGSYPTAPMGGNHTDWEVAYTNTAAQSIDLSVYVICTTRPPAP
jgi:hypothetical protein